MGAGSGFKTFASGDILTAADVNGYLMQGVWVFANAAARSAAVTSPQEGNASFLKDTNALEIYDGAAWVAYGSGDITGVTTGANSGLTGGATSGTADIKLNMAAKGDLIAGTGSGTSTVVTVGANNTVLTADSTATGGVKWATPSGGMTLIATSTPSAANTIQFASIPTTYKSLLLVWDSVYQSDATTYFSVRLNNDSASNYYYHGSFIATGGFGVTTAINDSKFGNGSQYSPIPNVSTSSTSYEKQANGYMWIFNADQTSGVKSIFYTSTGWVNGSSAQSGPIAINGQYRGSSAISQIDFIRSSTQTVTGTVRLYGVS